LEESDALGVRFCGQDPVVRRTDQNEVGIAFGTPQFGDCLQAAEAGQVLVEQDENEIGGAHQRQRFSAFDRLGHLQRKTGRRQNLADDAAHNRRVVHQQQAARQPQPARALWARNGSASSGVIDVLSRHYLFGGMKFAAGAPSGSGHDGIVIASRGGRGSDGQLGQGCQRARSPHRRRTVALEGDVAGP
jgi:hypothetical protein